MMPLPRPRFSLRTLVIAVLLAASGIGLWWRWEPWVCCRDIIGFSGWVWLESSLDGKSVRITDQVGSTIYDLDSGQSSNSPFEAEPCVSPPENIMAISHDGRLRLLAWEEGTEILATDNTREFLAHDECARAADFSRHGNLLATAFNHELIVWHIGPPRLKLFSVPGSGFSSRVGFSNDGRRIVWAEKGRCRVLDANTGAQLFCCDGASVAYGFAVLSGDDAYLIWQRCRGSVAVFHRRRPEYWWGIAWLPEFWCAVVFGVGLIWSVWRDGRVR